MPEDHFGPEVARSDEQAVADMFEPAAWSSRLSRCSQSQPAGGRALEFGIGTGRIALPLAARGVNVSGLEFSEAMVEQLHIKPGGRKIPVTIGDMARTRAEGSFQLVYLVFNTIGNHSTSRTSRSRALPMLLAHLQPGGHFVVEVGVPQLRRLPPGAHHVVFHADRDRWGIDEYDVASQRLVSHHMRREGSGLLDRAIPFR